MRVLIFAIVVIMLAGVLLRWMLAERETMVESRAESFSTAPAADAVPPTPPQYAPGPRDRSLPAVAETEERSAYRLETESDYLALATQLGVDPSELEQRYQAWMYRRGYSQPETDEGAATLLEQPYGQYDDPTLRGLADGGDMYALQILAARLEDRRPAEAMELYRQAAIHGSVAAMEALARLSRSYASQRQDLRFGDDESALEQVYALRDNPVPLSVSAYAWAAVAQMSGQMPGHETVLQQAARGLSHEQLAEACDLAKILYEDLQGQRQSLDRPAADREPPPILPDPTAGGRGSHCYAGGGVPFDTSGCREIAVEVAGEMQRFWHCGEQS